MICLKLENYVQWLLSLYLVGAACVQWKIGGGELIRLQIKTSLYFHWTHYTFNKTFPYFYFLPMFHWPNYILNKTFLLEGEKAQNMGKT